ncbi:hypothetical protein HDU93_009324 [Gonapodya sp. JEL0774]|nr:hypothetical protein HDU93_009324 [Gonapodya sp. JEL0774]
MKLERQIKLRLVLPVVLGMLVLGAATVALIYTQSSSWIDELASIIDDLQVRQTRTSSLLYFNASCESFPTNIHVKTQRPQITAVQSRAYGKASFVQSFVSSLVLDVRVLALYAASATRGTLGTIVRPIPSFFQLPLLDSPSVATPMPPETSRPLYSSYWSVNISTSADLAAAANSSMNSTVLDMVFRPLFLDKPGTNQLYTGFSDTGMRKFPYIFASSPNASFRTQRFCDAPDLDPSIRGKVGFIPACRGWYRSAVDAVRNASTTSTVNTVDGVGPWVIVSPYVDATTGTVIISASQAFLDASGVVVGVAALDANMDLFLSTFSQSSKILDNGYLLVMDTSGNLIVYDQAQARAKNISIYTSITNILSTDFPGDAPSAVAFLASAQQSATTKTSTTFLRGGRLWRLAATTVPDTSYLAVALVPVSDLQALSDSMRAKTATFGAAATAVIAVLLVVAAYVANRVSAHIADRVLRPVKNLTDFVNLVTSGNLDHEPINYGPVNTEIDTIGKNFRELLVAMRFGNTAYYAGDLNKALDSYLAAERVMTEFNSERGKGVCWNNLGNVYSQMDRLDLALIHYNKAIDSAERLLATEQDPSKRSALQSTLAERLMNKGVLFKVTNKPPEESVALFERAIELHRLNDSVDGIAQVSGNLGQMYLERRNMPKAEECIVNAYTEIKDRQRPVALQYAAMNMGLLAEAQGHKEDALAWFLYVLQRFEVSVHYVQKKCTQEVIRLCQDPAINKPDIAQTVFKVGRSIFPDLTIDGALAPIGQVTTHIDPQANVQMRMLMAGRKDLAFTLDVSGSMSGTFIHQCRTSINEIIYNHCGQNDRVALLVFDSTVRQVFDWTLATDRQKAVMRNLVDNNTPIGGSTAFWDALMATAKRMAAVKDHKGRSLWICTLTDGGDNASNSTSKSVIAELQRLPQVGLIAITVGALGNEAEIRKVCEASRNGGLFIRADASGQGIQSAFRAAIQHMEDYAVQHFN